MTRRPSIKTRMARLRSDRPDLARLVDQARLGLDDAEAVARDRERQKVAAQQQAAREAAEKAKIGRAWRIQGLPVPQTAADYRAYARYVMAHAPGLAGPVVHGGFPLHEAVRLAREWTRCPFPCDHQPLSADQITAFLALTW